MRNLLLLILVVFGIWWARGAVAAIQGARLVSGARPRTGASGKPEPMLECRHCGLMVPESEGVRVGETFYCCDEHRRAGPRPD